MKYIRAVLVTILLLTLAVGTGFVSFLRRVFTAILLLTVLAAFAAAQNPAIYSANWDGISRQYYVDLPAKMPPNPTLIVALHGTINDGQNSLVPQTACNTQLAWNQPIVDAHGIILLCPVSTWKPGVNGAKGYWFWEAYGTESYFSAAPDDSGFIRSLILQLKAQYSVGLVGVTGMSSGGMMAWRACIDNSDIVDACAVVSGSLWVGSSSTIPSQPVRPFSALILHGDADVTIPYCGGVFSGWGEVREAVPGVDAALDYVLAADGFAPNAAPLCAGNVPSGVNRLDFRGTNGVEVKVVKELTYGHVYRGWVPGTVVEFLIGQ